MEKSRANSRSTYKHHDEHVKDSTRHDTMIKSAVARERWPAGKDIDVEHSADNLDSPQPTLSFLQKPESYTRMRRWQLGGLHTFGYLLLLILSLCVLPTTAVEIEFENCLSNDVQNNDANGGLQLQFVPLFFDAVFNTTDPSHTLALRVWGNVTGTGPVIRQSPLPPPNNGYWDSNATDRGGKIIDVPSPDGNNVHTTLASSIDVLTYQNAQDFKPFCDNLTNGSCPLAPNFLANESVRSDWPSFGYSHNFYSTFAFTSFTARLEITYGNEQATSVGCVQAAVTPDIGSTLSGVLTFIPVVILILVGIATAFAGIFSPWGTSDTFRWTSNYGRDEDLLRLVTPGFGDCLQYLQFAVLTGGLTLNYPGFYQPIVSKVAWSSLMFNQSFVSNSSTDSLVDGVYVVKGRFGLDRIRQYVGMGAVDDVWAGMAVWLLVIIAVMLLLVQLGFLVRWALRHISDNQEEDLRAKNMPFTVGNVIRIVFNYFLLPLVALSMFQLAEASQSPTYTVALAVVMLALILGFAVWLLYFIVSTRPKSYLFDDLPTVLIYGPLYNTYSDNLASFALIPVLLTVVRGVAIGAVQQSGIAQLVLLAICEVIFILTLHAFRPFHSPTSMNAVHTLLAFIRLATVIIMLAFAPSLGVAEGAKGWIGYAILLTHAIVLLLGYLLNAIQTIVEVAARLAGAGGDETGATRGGLAKVFGMRQLSRRLPRRDGVSRQSQLSNTAMMDEEARKAYMMEGGRIRSQSAGSTGVLLNRQSTGLDSHVEAYGAIPPGPIGNGGSSHTPTTPGEASSFSFIPSAAAPSGLGRNRGPAVPLGDVDNADPYYRPPRLRRPTIDPYSPGSRSRGSWASGEWANKRWSQGDPAAAESPEEGPSISGRVTPTTPAPLDGSPGRSKADYTTREVDFYYGVRGPALNANVPSRRIKTGPADPTGPSAAAAGWFKGLFGGKTKEKGKGFEVVRSSRMPPGMKRPGQESPPEGVPVATGGVRNGPIDSDDESVERPPNRRENSIPAQPSVHENDNLVSPLQSDHDESEDSDEFEMQRISDIPPTLAGIDFSGGGIELPSRFPSKATSKASSRRYKELEGHPGPTGSNLPVPSRIPSLKPDVPRKSSRRKSQSVDLTAPGAQHLFLQHAHKGSTDSSRLPFDRSNSHHRHSTVSASSSVITPEPMGQHSRNHSSALGNLSADFRDDRPTSVGFVNQHSIQTINPRENPDFLGTTAEVVDGRNSGASSMENLRN